MPLEAAELAYRFIDASYRSTDSWVLDEHGGLPGVTREYLRATEAGKWGVFEYANAGIEGYGWGALSVHLLMRYLLGLREEEAGKITIAPMLPQALRRVGATYHIEPVQWGKHVLRIECIVRNEEGFAVRVRCSPSQVEETTYAVEKQRAQQWEWEGSWGEPRMFQLP